MSTVAPGLKPAEKQYLITAAQEATYKAWGLDPNWDDYMYWAWGLMYIETLIPSVLAMPFILVTKAYTNIYLIVDATFKFLGLGFHPARESFIWTMDNWWGYSFRRWIVDFILTPIHFFT